MYYGFNDWYVTTLAHLPPGIHLPLSREVDYLGGAETKVQEVESTLCVSGWITAVDRCVFPCCIASHGLGFIGKVGFILNMGKWKCKAFFVCSINIWMTES